MEESQKPVVFISHASTDGVFANAVKHEIEKVFADGVVVFSTSSSGAIGAGTEGGRTDPAVRARGRILLERV